MDCQELNIQQFNQLDLSENTSFLIIGNTRRTETMIKNLIKRGTGQHFTYMGHLNKEVIGHYDVAIIDGGDPTINPKGVYEELYPYLKRNVIDFYILVD